MIWWYQFEKSTFPHLHHFKYITLDTITTYNPLGSSHRKADPQFLYTPRNLSSPPISSSLLAAIRTAPWSVCPTNHMAKREVDPGGACCYVCLHPQLHDTHQQLLQCTIHFRVQQVENKRQNSHVHPHVNEAIALADVSCCSISLGCYSTMV
jgi:hypothetical protein